MGNVFDDTAPDGEPETIIAGDFLTWRRADLNADYANDTYTLSYKARLEGAGSTVITITAAASGTDYLVSETSATTASYTVGVYHWQAYITRDSDSARTTVDSGTFEVKPNRSAATTDPRTHAKTMVDKIESILESRADADVANYTINGRSLTKLSIDELLKWRSHYKAELLAEKQEERLANGDGSGRLIKVSFNL